VEKDHFEGPKVKVKEKVADSLTIADKKESGESTRKTSD
jgi:hypothetical protein